MIYTPDIERIDAKAKRLLEQRKSQGEAGDGMRHPRFMRLVGGFLPNAISRFADKLEREQ